MRHVSEVVGPTSQKRPRLWPLTKTTPSQILSYPDKYQGCGPAENHIGKMLEHLPAIPLKKSS